LALATLAGCLAAAPTAQAASEDLDQSFSDDGRQTTDFAASDDYGREVAIQEDGKIVVAGGHIGDFAVARYLP
jgi:hypothetical protein